MPGGEVTFNFSEPDELYLLVQVEQGPEGPPGKPGPKGDSGRNGANAPMAFNAFGGANSGDPAPSSAGGRTFAYFMS